MTDLRKAAQQVTPRADLLAELMDSNEPKTEREHAAVYEIERLRAALAQPDVPQGWVPPAGMKAAKVGYVRDGKLRTYTPVV